MLRIIRNKMIAPLPLAQGSFPERMKRSRELNNAFFEEIKDSFTHREIDPKNFLKKLKKIIPENIKAKVIDLADIEDEKKPSIYFDINSRKRFSGYKIILPFNRWSKKIELSKTSTFMHETQHLFDFMLNPKIIKRRINLVNNSNSPSESLDYYINEIYISKNFNKKKLKNFLKQKTPNEQIDFLQFCRYQLLTEQNAYKHSNPYQRKIEKIYKKEINYNADLTKYGAFQFTKKIKYIENLLSGIIQCQREQHKIRYSKNSVL